MRYLLKIACCVSVFFFVSFKCHAEISKAEEQVVFYMNYLVEMSYTAEHTEGMPKKDVENYLTENIVFLSETFEISPRDIHLLMLHKHHNRPLPENYNGPTLPTDEQIIEMNEKMKQSVKNYSLKIQNSHAIQGDGETKR